MRVRIAFGAALVLGLTGLVALDIATGTAWGSGALIAAALVFAVRELWRILEPLGAVPGRRSAMVLSVALVALRLAVGAPWADELDVLLLWGYVVTIWALALRHTPREEVTLGLALHGFGALYLLLPGVLILRLRAEPHGLWLLVFAVALAKGADMTAYFTGRWLGRRKLIPWISPGKTWAGAVGALLGALLVAAAFVGLSPVGSLLPWALALALAILAAAAGMLGDLVESLLKRSARRKDSGALVPEFGGVLDIIDSVLFVGPLVYAAVRLGRTAGWS